MSEKVVITIECSDLEVAAFIMAIHRVYEHDPLTETLDNSILALSVVRGINYLRDCLRWENNLLWEYLTESQTESLLDFLGFSEPLNKDAPTNRHNPSPKV